MRKSNTGQVEKGYVKNQVTYPKKGLLYLGSETCDQTQDKRDAERPRLKGAASCFTGHGEDAQMIAVPRVSYVPAPVLARQREAFSRRWKRRDRARIKARGAALDRTWTPNAAASLAKHTSEPFSVSKTSVSK